MLRSIELYKMDFSQMELRSAWTTCSPELPIPGFLYSQGRDSYNTYYMYLNKV